MRKNSILIAFMLLVTYLQAQFKESIEANRPGNALNVFTVGKNIFQIETAIDYSNSDDSFSSNSFFRYGVTENIEINGGVLYDLSSSYKIFNIGAKYNIFEGDDILPSTAIQLSINVPNETFYEHAFSSVLFILNYPLTERLSYTLNFGASVDFGKTKIMVEGKEKEKILVNGLYVLNIVYKLTDKWNFFIEPYGRFNGNLRPSRTLSFNSGFSYLVNKNLQLDVLGGYGINSKNYNTSFGISWRL